MNTLHLSREETDRAAERLEDRREETIGGFQFWRGRYAGPDPALPAGQSIILPAKRQQADDHNHNTSDSDAEDGLSACFGLVTKMNERPLLIPCPAHRSRRASAPALSLKTPQYVSNSGSQKIKLTPNTVRAWE